MKYSISWDEKSQSINVLLGKTLTSIIRDDKEETLEFNCSDGTKYLMYHSQDCCESVNIDDIVGELEDLLNSPITLAEESSNNDNPKSEQYGTKEESYTSIDDSCTWTFYKFATIKGYVDIRWYGSSNGYYSERVNFVEVKEVGGE